LALELQDYFDIKCIIYGSLLAHSGASGRGVTPRVNQPTSTNWYHRSREPHCHTSQLATPDTMPRKVEESILAATGQLAGQTLNSNQTTRPSKKGQEPTRRLTESCLLLKRVQLRPVLMSL